MTRTTTKVRGHPVGVAVESCSRCGEMRSAGWWATGDGMKQLFTLTGATDGFVG